MSAFSNKSAASVLDRILEPLLRADGVEPERATKLEREKAIKKLLKRAEIIERNLRPSYPNVETGMGDSVLRDLLVKRADHEAFPNKSSAMAFVEKCIINKMSRRSQRRSKTTQVESRPMGAAEGEIDPTVCSTGQSREPDPAMLAEVNEEAARGKRDAERTRIHLLKKISQVRNSRHRQVLEIHVANPEIAWSDIAEKVGNSEDNCRKIWSRFLVIARQ